MKKIYLMILMLSLIVIANAQTIFWIENFNNACSSLCTSYTGPNGAWTFASNGPTTDCGGATTPNLWYISCAENGNAAGSCGSGCGNNGTLHVGNDPLSPSAGAFCPTGDCGAAYDAGGYCVILGTPPSTVTDILATSPTIDCSGRSTITLSFNYIERGQGVNDNATVEYFDGTTWSLLADMAKTPTNCGAGQGRWTIFSMALPASANNNPNVGLAFHWVNDDDGNGNDPSFAVDSVRLTVTSAGVPPLANFTQGPTAGCDSLCVTFTDSSTGATSWAWSFPGGNPSTSTSASPVVCYHTSGSFDVTQIVTNAFGTDTLLKSGLVTITPTPIPDFTSTNQNLCVGDCIDYTDLSTGTVTSYIWTFQGGTPVNSSLQNPTNICYNVGGSFNSTFTVENGSCINSNTHVGYINVNQPTPPSIQVAGDTLICSPSLTYQWYEVSTGAIPAGIFQDYVAVQGGNYYVCITDVFGCTSCSDTVHVDQEGINDVDLSHAFSVFPNPAHDKLTISTSIALKNLSISIKDVAGRVVKTETLSLINNKTEISLDGLTKGSYLIQITDERKKIIFSAPVVKQ